VTGDASSTAAETPPVRAPFRVVVAGMGNEYRRDDGAGPAVAAASAKEAPATIDIGPVVDPLDLLGRWDRADLAIVVDALRSGGTPGTVQVLDVTEWGSGPGATSTHGIGLPGVLRLAQALDQAPARVVVVGIEGEDFAMGTGLSPAVDAAVPLAVRSVVELIKEVQACA